MLWLCQISPARSLPLAWFCGATLRSCPPSDIIHSHPSLSSYNCVTGSSSASQVKSIGNFQNQSSISVPGLTEYKSCISKVTSCLHLKISREPQAPESVSLSSVGFRRPWCSNRMYPEGSFNIVLEVSTQFKVLGDIISLQPKAGRIFARWPGMTEQLYPICHDDKALKLKTYKGEELFTQDLDLEHKFGKKFSGHRGEIHELVWNYAKGLEIEIRLGQVISEYFETDSEAGVVSNGVRLVGDVVLAGDGVRSTGRTSVLGYEDNPQKSGYAVYRAWLDSTEIKNNPLTSYMVENGDTFNAWAGPDKHFLATSFKDGKDFSWVCTHKVRISFGLLKDITNNIIRMTQTSKKAGKRPAKSKTPSNVSKVGTLSSAPSSVQLQPAWTGKPSTATHFPLGYLPKPA